MYVKISLADGAREICIQGVYLLCCVKCTQFAGV
jgi:hypothetical protein